MEFRRGRLTGISALEIAKLMGVSRIRMLCFDAIVNGNTEYATCIGHEPSGNTKRFIEFKTRYTKYTKGLNVEWVKAIA
jgi:hypothetical protein